jgi:2-oxoglutarate ferredoxin oxidoreductase subunit alpha
MARLSRKYETARQYMPKPVLTGSGRSKIGLIAFGSTETAILEALDQLKDEEIVADFLRLRALPLVEEVGEFIKNHDHIYIVELNRDGQLHQILNIKYPEFSSKMTSLTKHDGLSLTANWVTQTVLVKEKK